MQGLGDSRLLDTRLERTVGKKTGQPDLRIDRELSVVEREFQRAMCLLCGGKVHGTRTT
jgi:hypothetical protein